MKVVLIVLDGWGISSKRKGNAIRTARKPYVDKLMRTCAKSTLHAAGKHVGLLPGNMGNSEVGHFHLGAGRLVKQDLTRIFDAIKNKSFFKNPVLVKAMKRAQGHSLHLLGLVSDGGVHSHIGHLSGLLTMAQKRKVKNVFVHAITDGRDVPPQSCVTYLRNVDRNLKQHNKNWKIATVMGRFYAMDRDNRWNREHKAYDAMVNCKGYQHAHWRDAVQAAYARGETDEFIKPSIVGGSTCNVKPGDVVIFFNFRSDRARELTRAFVQGRFNKFKRKKIVNLHFVCLTQYDPAIKTPVAFPPMHVSNTLGEVIAKKGFRQCRLAETEKWAHVTYFFNGLSGKIFSGEDRLLIPSPKITTYDKKPAMSAYKIARKAKELLKKGKHQFILINFANADMVGHTGNVRKTVQAVTVIDHCLQEVVETAKEHEYAVVITADHGNAEEMKYPDGSICTAHSTNQVPLLLVGNRALRKTGHLYDVAPTILDLMGVKKPKIMTGKSLLR